jgi:hypothetical protein
MKILIEAVSGDPNADIKDNTRRQRVIDANAILEALLLEYGVEAALEAVVKQGFSSGGNYGTITRQLYECAVQRKSERRIKSGGSV